MSIIFKPLEQKELPGFRADVKRIFSIAVIETSGVESKRIGFSR